LLALNLGTWRIEKAKQDWREQWFAAVPDETEFVPLLGEG
jgi:hypothetical protein